MNKIRYTNDAHLNSTSKSILKNRYLLSGELYQELFFRVSIKYSDDIFHAKRVYNYISKLWLIPATPILSNGGSKRGLPISCFVNEVKDNLEGIVSLWNENVWLSSRGGGVGTYWGNVRSVGEKIFNSGKSSGIIPFLSVQDKLTLAISQGSLRRGSSAVYLSIDHPEIEEFIDMRKITGGDPNRKNINLHHGIIISDQFMKNVRDNLAWPLISPLHYNQVAEINARELWAKILTTRIETGEPYILFIDTINKNRSRVYKKQNVVITTSNLCTEITLITGVDHIKNSRTGVCCLSSLNIVYYHQWKCDNMFILDVTCFLDNILQDFINRAPKNMFSAKYSAYRERSIGLGVLGLHSFFQSKFISLANIATRIWNLKIFKHIYQRSILASKLIGKIKNCCPDANNSEIIVRFTHSIAVAPTASISIIGGGISPGIEPNNSNFYLQKTVTGSLKIINSNLLQLLKTKNNDNKMSLQSIITNEGSVHQFNFLNYKEKNIFKTSFEIEQNIIISLASDRSPYICQMQSINIFNSANINKTKLNAIYYNAWKNGIKSIYYTRSKSLQRSNKTIKC